MQQCRYAAMQQCLKEPSFKATKQHWPAKTKQFCAQPQAHYITLDKLAFSMHMLNII